MRLAALELGAWQNSRDFSLGDMALRSLVVRELSVFRR
jgi:hypothetical protein